MALTTTQGSAAYLNRALNDANATPTAFAATAADLAANEMAAADKFDVATLTDAALSKQVLTNMGVLPSTNVDVLKLETELTAYFGGMGKGHRGFVVLQLSRILADKTADATYGTAATAWNAEVAASVADSTSQTLALTTSLTDSLAGGQADDIFTAITSALSTTNTLSATDKIVGGTGNDTFNVTMGDTFAGFTVGTGSVSGVETINLTNSGTAAKSFNARGVTDATTYNLTGEVNVSNLDTVASKVNLKTVAAPTAAITIGHTAEATVGTADSKTIGVQGIGGSTTVATVTVNGIENLTLESSGTATNYVALADDVIKTLTITGSGPLTLSGLGGTGSIISSVDASAATGVQTFTLTDGYLKGIKTVKTGSAADSITLNPSDDVAVNATIDAGAGANSLTLTGGAADVEYVLSGVQSVSLGARTGTLNFSAAKATTAIDTITVGTTAQAVTSNFANMGTGNLTVSVTSDANAATAPYAHTLTADNSGAATLNVTVSSAATAAKTQTATDIISFGKATSLTMSVAKFGEYTGNVTADKATTAGVTVNGLLQDTITGAEMTSVTVNQTNKDVTASTLTLATPKATTLDLTVAGGLAVTPGAALGTVQTLKVATDVAFGTNALDFTAPTSVTISGAATASATTLGLLGATSQAYGLTLTATGQKAGLTVAGTTGEFIKTDKDQVISLDITGTTGDRNIAYTTDIAVSKNGSDDSGLITILAAGSGATGKVLNIGTTTAKTVSIDVQKSIGNTTIGTIASNITGGSATIKAAGLTGTLSVGTVGAKTIIADVTDVTGAVSFTGTLTGDSVTVTGANAAGGITNGSSGAVGIAAKTSLTYTGSSAVANTMTNTVGSGSTAFSAKLDGGFLQDNYTITSTRTTQTSITLTGNLGNFVSGSADSVTVTSMASTAAAGQTIDLSGLTVAEGATTTIRGSTVTTNTLKGGAGNDTIYGGAKADVVFLGTGTDTYVLNNPTDTGTVLASKIANNTAITAGGSISTTDLDIVNNFSTGDLLYVGVAFTATTSQYSYGTNFVVAANGSKLVSGNYDSSAGTFIFASSGKDSLFVYDGDADATNAYQAIVLVGYVTTTATTASSGGFVTGITGVAA